MKVNLDLGFIKLMISNSGGKSIDALIGTILVVEVDKNGVSLVSLSFTTFRLSDEDWKSEEEVEKEEI